MLKYDVVIIGAGPSGVSTAINLVNSGIKNICIIEKAKFPRIKPCAGLLSKKAYAELKLLGIDAIKDLKDRSIDKYQVYYKNKLKVNMKNVNGFTGSLNGTRSKLDMALYHKVKDLDIKIYENIKIKDVDLDKNIVITDDEQYKYNYLVFADGMSGYSAKYHDVKRKKNICMETIIKSHNPNSFCQLHFGITKNGYAWIGNTGENINIGFSDIFDKNNDYKKLLKTFAKANGYNINDKDIRGAFTPFGVNEQVVINSNTYFVGDAAGLTDPFSIEGIYYALATGRFCASSIKNKNSDEYLSSVEPFIDRFKKAKKTMKKFYEPWFQFIAWNIMGKITPGFITYGFDKLMLENKYNYNQAVECLMDYIKRRKKK